MHYLYKATDLIFSKQKTSCNRTPSGSLVVASISRARSIVTLSLIFLFMLSSYGENTQPIRHTADSGYWWDPNTWEDRVIPQPGEHAWILEEHEVLLDDFARIHSLTIDDGGTLTVIHGQILVIENQGTFTNHGTFNAGNGRVEFAHEASTAGTNEIVFHDVGIVGTDVQIETDITFVSGTLHMFSGSVASAPVYLEGSVLRYATGGDYLRVTEWNDPWHVQVSGETVLDLNFAGFYPNDLVVQGNLTIDAGSEVFFSDEQDTTVFRVFGNVVGNSNIIFAPSGYTVRDFYIGGDFIIGYFNHPFLSYENNSLIFNGSQPQNLVGSYFNVNNLIVEQGTELILHSNIFIDNNMTVRTGATINAGNHTINGNQTGQDSFTLEADATLTARFLEPPPGEEYYGNLPELMDGILINSLSAQGYWEIEAENIRNSNYTLELQQPDFDGISDPSSIRILKRQDYQDDWDMAGSNFSYSFDHSSNRYSFIQQDIIGFSDFALGSNFSQNPLPVEWLAFDATPKDQKVLLTWQTATETNNSHFTVLHSTDGLNFRELGHKPGAGNSNQLLSYSFKDHHPEPGVNYYRIRQTDFDGTTDYSNLVAVDLTLSQEPNIFCHNQTIHFSLQGHQTNTWDYQIYRTDGGLVHSGKLPPAYDANPYTWDSSLYAGQILLVRLTNNQESFVRKILVR